MKRFALLISLFATASQAGVYLRMEHPRNPSHVRDFYQIKCSGRCLLEIKAGEQLRGFSSSKKIQEKINDLLKMKVKGELPQSREDARLVMYKIEAASGKDRVSLVLAYPLSYTGEEYTKYANVISLIEDLKLMMKLELTEKK